MPMGKKLNYEKWNTHYIYVINLFRRIWQHSIAGFIFVQKDKSCI